MFFFIRHGERSDESSAAPDEKAKIELDYDPHLTARGLKQAQATGKVIQ